jgi:hypothetical protein
MECIKGATLYPPGRVEKCWAGVGCAGLGGVGRTTADLGWAGGVGDLLGGGGQQAVGQHVDV